MSSIEHLLSSAAKDFDSFVNQNLKLDWAQRKDEVRESFGILVQKKAKLDGTDVAPFNPKLPYGVTEVQAFLTVAQAV